MNFFIVIFKTFAPQKKCSISAGLMGQVLKSFWNLLLLLLELTAVKSVFPIHKRVSFRHSTGIKLDVNWVLGLLGLNGDVLMPCINSLTGIYAFFLNWKRFLQVVWLESLLFQMWLLDSHKSQGYMTKTLLSWVGDLSDDGCSILSKERQYSRKVTVRKVMFHVFALMYMTRFRWRWVED